ncbi:transglutaminase [Rhizocola hellebori]|uniref:Transglutaminase n=1 Tax=Rhizocola hellebori TaxID=1392758 RepID=A0A8J3VJH8_9ACTN|nr:transglutaminase-like domain-containing protein [Rhizocola hellebori]GIH09444.1 transglutaminase [Rhizocola hellebori]
MKRDSYPTAVWDVATIAVTTVVALTALDSVYAGRRYLLTGAIGLGLGLGLGWLANRLRWMPPTAILAGLAPVTVAAGLLALPETMLFFVVPSLRTLDGLWAGAVDGWRGLLTTVPPVVDDGPLLLVPYLGGFAAALSAVLLAGRVKLLVAPVLPGALLLVAGLLLGTREPVSVLLNGTAFAALALVAVTVRDRRRSGTKVPGRSQVARQLGQSTTMVAVAAGAAWMLALPPAVSGVDDRYVLREHIELPFDANVYPSPLAGFRRYEVLQKDKVLFNIVGLPNDARLRLAVMDNYDGLVWTVAQGGGRRAASGVFERIGARIPATVKGTEARLQITIRELGGVWVPIAGEPTAITFPGQRGGELTDAFRLNRASQTGVMAGHSLLRDGDTIAMDVVVPPAMDWQSKGKSLAGQAVQAVSLPTLEGVPDRVGAVVAERTSGMTGAYEMLDSLYKALQGGDFSDGTGLAGTGLTVLPGHSAGRMREFLTGPRPVGDPEQYAAAFGLLARELDLPARVVLGVRPKERNGATDITGGMVTAWVEVKFAEAGWVAIDPTPEVHNKPKPPDPPARHEGNAQLIQPPIVPEMPPAQMPPPGEEGIDPPPEPPCGLCDAALQFLKYAGPPLLFIGLLAGLILGLKAWRRRRRRRYPTVRLRVAGGWLELLDRLRDHRVPVPADLSRRETVTALYRMSDKDLGPAHKRAIRELAHLADRCVFAPDQFEPPEQDQKFWSTMDDALRALSRETSFWQRLAARLNPTTLLPAAAIAALPFGIRP